LYNSALTTSLFTYSFEDSQSFGRLSEIKDLLQKFDSRIVPLDEEEQMQFFLHDIKMYKTLHTLRPDKQEVILSFRQQYLCDKN